MDHGWVPVPYHWVQWFMQGGSARDCCMRPERHEWGSQQQALAEATTECASGHPPDQAPATCPASSDLDIPSNWVSTSAAHAT